MTLAVRLDHRLDRLADALIEALAEPPPHPFAEDVVLVPSLGVGRWLAQRVAQRHGVCARLTVEFPGRFLWRTFCALLPDLPAHSPFDPQSVRWPLLALLESLPPDEPALALPAQRIQAATPLERFALAGEIAAQFERYLAYRRDWLLRWQRDEHAHGAGPLGPHEPWQRWLWRRLLERLPGLSGRHPVDRVVELLERTPDRARQALGAQRIAMLGAVGLAPEALEMLARLGAVCDVTLYGIDPCRELWSDLLDPRAVARVCAQRPDEAWLYDDAPSVLGSWGRAHRDQVAQLLALEERVGLQIHAPFRDEVTHADAAAADGSALRLTRLQALQSSVLLRSDQPWSAVDPQAADASLQVHATHGVLRQAEVLQDCLLECFETIDQLRPDEVAVFCASVDTAADAIEAVFASAPSARRIPIAISGRSRRAEPLVAALLGFLEIAARQAPLAAVARWLDNPAVRAGLALDGESATALVDWLDAAGARWGLDDRDGPAKHHWQAALDRMLLGVAAGRESALLGDVVPVVAPRGGGPGLLEALVSLLDALSQWRDASRAPRTIAHWCTLLRRIAERLFGRARAQSDTLALAFDALAELERGAQGEPDLAIESEAFAQALAEALEQGASAALPSGAVTVCGLGGLRGVPFRVICLFGLDDGAFPRRASAGEFDLMPRAPRFGDRIARLDDRGAFLDALLAAGERVIVLHTGRDARDDSPRNPSILVSELLDYVAQRLPSAAPLVVEHPLHGFSPRAFRAPHATRAAEWWDTACALSRSLKRRPASLGPLAQPVPYGEGDRGEGVHAGAAGALRDDAAGAADMPPTLSLREAREALADPARTWLRRALGLRLPPDHLALDEHEPLWDDPERDRGLVDEIAGRWLAGADPLALRAQLVASPVTAARAAGAMHADALIERAARLADAAWGDAPRAPLAPVSITFGIPHADGAPLRVTGVLALPGQGGCQPLVTAFPLGAAAVIRAWLAHAAWVRWLTAQGAGPETVDAAVTRLAAADATVTLRGAQAGRSLDAALAWALRIRREPLPLLPRTSFAYHRHDASLGQAAEAMFGDDAGRRAAEIDRPWNVALYRDAPPPLEDVVALGAEVYGPIFSSCAIVSTKKKEAA